MEPISAWSPRTTSFKRKGIFNLISPQRVTAEKEGGRERSSGVGEKALDSAGYYMAMCSKEHEWAENHSNINSRVAAQIFSCANQLANTAGMVPVTLRGTLIEVEAWQRTKRANGLYNVLIKIASITSTCIRRRALLRNACIHIAT